MTDFDWLLQPAVQDAIIAMGTLGSLALWIAAKVESRSNSRAIRALRESTDGSIRGLGERLESSRVPVEETSVPQIQGLNLTTRTKVLRMHHRGEQAETIAAALRLQREEVELLLKLDRLFEGSR